MKLTILGDPVAKGRPKLTSFGGHARAYTPAKTRMAEDHIRSQIANQLPKGFVPFACPIWITIGIYKSKPKHAKKTDIYPSRRPDLDNYIKTVLDAMNMVVFQDDALICSIKAQKDYDAIPRIEIEINEYLYKVKP
jgi:Holliday junction resolvase RusA-like endonuclease